MIDRPLFLGIEIGGTKLQLGVGDGTGPQLRALERREVVVNDQADGILRQIQSVGSELLERYHVSAIGVGFGGPVDSAAGRVTKSHQIQGWESLPLGEWCRATFGLPVVLGNDCDVAALAEWHLGAGRGHDSALFVTVGTGIGGGLVLNGQLHGAGRPAAAEIGHLRPGLDASDPSQTVESLAAGPAITAAARRMLAGEGRERLPPECVADLLDRCGGNADGLTAASVADAAAAGNSLAVVALDGACRALGWAIGQIVTLVAPEVVIVGGGVSFSAERVFWEPLRRYADQYIFPPLRGSFAIVPAALGESVVVHGAIVLGREGALRRGPA